MKQLTCEMCGSIDLIKQDGVFVCQTCGTKYSVEEAKKMMIEGTVKIDKTSEVDNLTKRMFDFIDDGEWGIANRYKEKILDIDVNNINAYLCEILSHSHCTIKKLNKNIAAHIDIISSERIEIIKEKATESIREIVKSIEKEYVKIDDNENVKGHLLLVCGRKKFMKVNTITHIDGDSLSYCQGLTSVIIPCQIKSLGDNAFIGCKKLRSVTFEEGSSLYSIGSWAFVGCLNLENIILPDSITSVGYQAFMGCKKLNLGIFECLLERLEKEKEQYVLQIDDLRNSKQDVPSLRLQVKMQKEIEVLEKTKKTMFFRFKAKKEIEEKINELSNKIYENNAQVGVEWREIEDKINATQCKLDDVNIRIENYKRIRMYGFDD